MTLRDEIAKIVYGEHHPNDITWHNCRPKADKVLALIAPELEKAKRYDKADILIQQFKMSAPTDRHVIGLINSFVGIIETLAGKEVKIVEREDE